MDIPDAHARGPSAPLSLRSGRGMLAVSRGEGYSEPQLSQRFQIRDQIVDIRSLEISERLRHEIAEAVDYHN
jgi:hypothetical protein